MRRSRPHSARPTSPQQRSNLPDTEAIRHEAQNYLKSDLAHRAAMRRRDARDRRRAFWRRIFGWMPFGRQR